MKEMIILPDGKVIHRVVTDYALDITTNRYKAEIEYKGTIYAVHFYNNFWT